MEAEFVITTNLPFSGLGDRTHLEREKALNQFKAFLNDADTPREVLLDAVQFLKTLIEADVWERKLGGLNAAKVLVEADRASEQVQDYLLQQCLDLLEHQEVRVRNAVGDLLGALAARSGVSVYEQSRDRLLSSIYEHFDREGEGDKAKPQPARGSGLVSSLLARSYRAHAPGHGDLRHASEGWKCLESSVRAFQAVMAACGADFRPHLTADVRQLLYMALSHPNRFVRETGHGLVGAMCATLGADELAPVATEVAEKLRDGLSDNWSQVRYAALCSTHSFLRALHGLEAELRVWPLLLPPLCLNRYYVAEGVRLLAQQVWREALGDAGRRTVADNIEHVVSYDVLQSKANNHAVREAACACIAELMEKVDRAAVAPHVPALLAALVTCFKDSSWPVRDAACVACGRCVCAYPEESREVLDTLWALWAAHLWDNIPSVRQDSAQALAAAAKTYGKEAIEKLPAMVSELLAKAAEQPSESERYSDLEQGSSFGVAARRARDNDAELHSDQELMSCGSLIARFSTSRLVRSDGCNDYGFSRPQQPWEAADGGVYLLRELAALDPAAAAALLPALADVVRIVSFQHAFHLHDTAWRCLPTIAARLGKRLFKPHLELFIPQMFNDLKCGHQLAEASAAECIGAMRSFLGPSIWAARLTPDQLALQRRHVDEAPPAGAGMGPGISLFAGLAGLGGPGIKPGQAGTKPGQQGPGATPQGSRQVPV